MGSIVGNTTIQTNIKYDLGFLNVFNDESINGFIVVEMTVGFIQLQQVV